MGNRRVLGVIFLTFLSLVDSIRFSTHSSNPSHASSQRLNLNSDKNKRYEEFQKRSIHADSAISHKSEAFADEFKQEAYRSNNSRNVSRTLDPILQMADLRDRPWSLQKSQIEDSDFNMSMKDVGKHLEETSRNSLNASYLPRSKAGKARFTNSTKSSSIPKERRSFNLNFVRYMSTIVAYFHLFWSSICNLRALDFCTKRIPDAARKFVPSTPTR